MKKIMLKIKYMAMVLCSVGVLTSCEDFLNTVPLNEIVLENFWETEEEVNSVVMSCYSGMIQGDFLTRLILWGELRSENMVAGSITGEIPYVNNDQLLDMLDGSILPNHYIADWSSFYRVINRCNTVLEYAPEVLERDPDFKDSEWGYLQAEMLTLRALCYFYLVRSFRDVPFVTKATKDDSQDFKVAASDPDVVLDSLVNDLKIAERTALREFPETVYPKSRVTKQVVWTLLADICLWMERYDECIAYCEKVIAAKIEDAERENMAYEGNYPLIANQKLSASNGVHQAYNRIFGTTNVGVRGNSFESIFEMPFNYVYDEKHDVIRSYYGSDNFSGALSASTFVAEAADKGNEIYDAGDIRAVEAFSLSNNSINKYVCYNLSDNGDGAKNMSEFPNWIFYRLTDVMLMEAEALVERNDSIDSKATDLEKAFDLASSVYHRANLKGEALSFSGELATQGGLRDFVLEERHRELMFEGKRWFDLVRKARREGDNGAMLDLATRKYTNPSSVKSKWKKNDMLYLPIHEDELKVNSLLQQNPAYVTDKTITTAK